MSSRMKMAREEVRADAKQEWEADAALRAEFSHDFDRYVAYKAAVFTGNVRVLMDQTRGLTDV